MRRVFLFYALSGFVSLGYQISWFRIVTDWFGSTNLTFTLVVCSFIGGLGVGSLLSDRLAGFLGRTFRLDDRLRLYGLIEIIISAAALLTPLVDFVPADLWGDFPYVLSDGIWYQAPAYQLSQIAIAIACVFVPCLFMGATFPLLCHVFVGSRRGGQFPSSLYAWNTLGACTGVLACQFILVLWIGHVPMFWLMAAINLALGLYFLATGGDPGPGVVEPVARGEQTASTGQPRKQALYGSLVILAAISGFLSGALEGDLFKRLSFMIASNPGAMMSFISFWVIAAIFLGSTIVRYSPRLNLISIRAGLFVALGYYFFIWLTGDAITFLMGPVSLREIGATFPDSIFTLFLFTGIFAFPPYLLISLLLPYACNGLQRQGRHLGLAYGLNTVAFCIGMIMFTQIATRVNIFYSLKLFFGVMAVVAFSLLLISTHQRPEKWKIFGVFAALGLVSLLTPAEFDKSFFPPSQIPHTRPASSMMSNGADTTFVVDMQDEMGSKKLFFGRISMSSTNFIGSTYMRLMAHFPLLAQEKPVKALLICFGVGNTASAIAAHDSIEQIDIVDLNYNVFKTAPQFAKTHFNVQLDPRVRLINDDGRSFLNKTGETYDLITSEPPPPMNAGVYRLYSREYYESILAHLNEGGFMTQWFPFHQMPKEAQAMAVRTFTSVFPHTLLIQGIYANLILVGSPSPIALGRIRDRFFDSGRVVDDLNRIDIGSSSDLIERIMLTDSELHAKYGDGKVISDQHNDLEHIFMDEREQLEKARELTL